jgi:microcystin-dependent protein
MSIIASLPYNLTNGTTADATQVMSNFNTIVTDVNENAATAGTNSDITELTGLTTALSVSQGGTGAGSVGAAGTTLGTEDGSTLTYNVMFSTGDVKMTWKTSPDTGWIMHDDGTIGNASSGASNRANADTAALFTLLWNNVSNTYAPVSSGRGANAAADFAANKTITLPAFLGRAAALSGSGSGLTARTLGENVGEETHTMTSGELVSHTHTASVSDSGHSHGISSNGVNSINSGATHNAADDGTGPSSSGLTTASATTGISVTNASTGSTTPFNQMQPTTFINMMIKL